MRIRNNAATRTDSALCADSSLVRPGRLSRCVTGKHGKDTAVSGTVTGIRSSTLALGAFFCSAVRNLRRGTVPVIRDGMLADTGERRLGCVIADDVETGVRTTVMPGRRITKTPATPRIP